MASKRDQLQSHQFLLQRMVHALVLRETDPEQPPFRRSVQAAWGGLAVAVLSLAAVWVFALIHPGGNSSWRDGKSVIVEKEGGARMVYVDHVLYPVPNLTSAMLILGQHAATQVVSAASLGSTPRGPMIGISGAPDALPASNELLAGAWTLCSVPGRGLDGAAVQTTALTVGGKPDGGTAMHGQAVIVRNGAALYLVWHGYRHLVTDQAATEAALLLADRPRLSVTSSWLDLIPSGPALGPLRPTNLGGASEALPSAVSGRLYVVHATSGQVQYYLADASTLRPISPLQYDLQRAWAPTRRAYGGRAPVAVALDPAVAAGARLTVGDEVGAANALPVTVPPIADADAAHDPACATFAGAAGVPTVSVGAVMPTPSPAAVTPGASAAGLPVADAVMVAPGHAALVRSMSSPDAPTGPLYLVTDMGRRFALTDTGALDLLGLAGASPIELPAALLARVPAGPALDPRAALRPV